MTADAEGSLIRQNGMPQRTSSRQKEDSVQEDSSSELIRWRADQLLDEMMLGAVDVSAADHMSSDDRESVASGAKVASSHSSSPSPTDEHYGSNGGFVTHVDGHRVGSSSQGSRHSDAGEPPHDDTPLNKSDVPYWAVDVPRTNAASHTGNSSGYPEVAADFSAQPNSGQNDVGQLDEGADIQDAQNATASPPKWMDDDWRPRQAEDNRRSDYFGSADSVGSNGSGSAQSADTDVRREERERQDVDGKAAASNEGYLFSSALHSDLDNLRAPRLSGEEFAEDNVQHDLVNDDTGFRAPSRQEDSGNSDKSEPDQPESTSSYERTVYENFPGERTTTGGGQEGRSTERKSWQDATLPRVQSGGGFASDASRARSGSSSSAASYGYRTTNGAGETYGHEPDNRGDNRNVSVTRDASDAVQQGVYASAMSVSPVGKKIRSNLLPRMSTLDAESLNQEILALHEEIREILPIGHETAERARHLLDKAHTILHSDPMRSAEVEYYMQQVRAIVQRIRQTYHWSNLYRARLQLYLTAWALLSFVVLVAQSLFPVQVEVFWMAFTGLGAENAFIRHMPVIMATLFAGTMGGAIGALYTMFQHARREYGFFDRKYGLRGIMLPIIGAMAGGILYALFAGVFQLFGIASTDNLALGLLPAVMALLFGLGQESLYGTRS